jgi:hypothetical protein
MFLERTLVDDPSAKGGGGSVYLYKNLPFSIINIEQFCEDKELEACALRLDFFYPLESVLLLFTDHPMVTFSIS